MFRIISCEGSSILLSCHHLLGLSASKATITYTDIGPLSIAKGLSVVSNHLLRRIIDLLNCHHLLGLSAFKATIPYTNKVPFPVSHHFLGLSATAKGLSVVLNHLLRRIIDLLNCHHLLGLSTFKATITYIYKVRFPVSHRVDLLASAKGLSVVSNHLLRRIIDLLNCHHLLGLSAFKATIPYTNKVPFPVSHHFLGLSATAKGLSVVLNHLLRRIIDLLNCHHLLGLSTFKATITYIYKVRFPVSHRVDLLASAKGLSVVSNHLLRRIIDSP